MEQLYGTVERLFPDADERGKVWAALLSKAESDRPFYLLGVDDSVRSALRSLLPSPSPDDDPRIKRQILGTHVNRSREWARTVLMPFDYSVVEPVDLKKALEEPLPLQIPISQSVYSTLEPDLARHFISLHEYSADDISWCPNLFMSSNNQEGSESLRQSSWQFAFCTFWRTLLSLIETTMVEFDWNVTDCSGASGNSVPPDLLLWVANRLVAKFEENKDSLIDAYNDLVFKMNELPAQFYGPVQWILGIGLAGGKMCVWSMKKGYDPDNLSDVLSLAYPSHRYKCIQMSVNILRVALTLKEQFKMLTYLPRPFSVLPSLVYGKNESVKRKLYIISPSVVKTIEPWSIHVEEGFTTLDYVTQAYKTKAPQLIRGTCTVERNNRYKAVLNEVGYEQAIVSEHFMKEAIREVLRALMALHNAGVVHRDVRWKNILRKLDGGWMLIDFETVWKSGEIPTCSLRAWDEKTLDDDGVYTEQSDLYLVGKLMEKFSTAGYSLCYSLLNRAYNSAEDALEDEWLH